MVSTTQILIPLFYTIITLIIIKTFPKPHNSKTLTLIIKKYKKNTITYNNNNFINKSLINQFYNNQFQNNKNHITYINNITKYKKNSNLNNYLFKKNQNNPKLYNLKYTINTNFTKHQNTIITTNYFNNQNYHTPTISLTTLTNTILQYITNNTQYTLTTINHPLPKTKKQKIRKKTQKNTTNFTITFNFIFKITFLSNNFILFLIKKKTTKTKHIQFINKIQPITF